MRPILPFLRHVLRRRQFDADLREELEFHHAMKQRELEARGCAPGDAAWLAQRALGSRALAEDQARDVWRPRWLQGLGGDVRVALRSFVATKVATSVAALSLTLGIGANTAIFSLVNGLLLRSLPVGASDRLALVSSTDITAYRPTFSFATFDQIRRHRLFDGVGAFTTCCSQSTVTIDGTRELVYREFFSGDFFRTLGLQASVGRLITPADDVDGSKPDGQIVVISDRLWKRRFGGKADVIGRVLVVDHATLTIVGVLPAEFLGLEIGRTFDIAMPLGTQLGTGDFAGNYERTVPILNILIRRHPDQTLDAALATLRAVQPQVRDDSMPTTFNADFLKSPFVLHPMSLGTSTLRERFARPLIAILVVVLLVLLIACVNVANLLLARSTARQHELSVRVALGASRWRLARQLLVESVVLSAIGTAGGMLFAPSAVRLLVSQLSVASAPVVLDLSFDWRTGLFTAALMITTVVLFSVAPALRATHVAPMDALRDRVTSAKVRLGGAGSGVADALIIGQVALSLTLIVAAGLFIRTFEQLARVPLGFERDHVLGVTANAQNIAAADRNALYHRLARAAGDVVGVTHAGGSSIRPCGDFFRAILLCRPPAHGRRPMPNGSASRISSRQNRLRRTASPFTQDVISTVGTRRTLRRS
jgi:putative ABC transport system permease protein